MRIDWLDVLVLLAIVYVVTRDRQAAQQPRAIRV